MNLPDTILVIDDEVQIRRLLEITLSSNGFKIFEAGTGKDGVDSSCHSCTLLLLFLIWVCRILMVLKVLKKIREWYLKPIIILSVRNSEEDIISALDNGANDFLTKPFRTGELLARIRVALRPAAGGDVNSVLTFGNFTIDLANHISRKNDCILKLTSTEFSLLSLLAKNSGRVLTHQSILKEIWGFGYIGQTQI